jgi:hypothetical protein
MLFDRTCRGGRLRPGLSHAWAAGGRLYHRLGRIDHWYGAASWGEGLDWLADVACDQPIAEIQYWGHGRWGGLWMANELLVTTALEPGHRHHARLAAIKARMTPESLWWFRCCDVFGTEAGHDFARRWTRFFGCRAAGHTHTIHVLQSGLHVLGPDEEPAWSVTEGVRPGVDRASRSSPFAPNTISFLHGRVR